MINDIKKKYKVWEVFEYEKVSEEFVLSAGDTSPNPQTKKIKSTSVRYSDMEKYGFFAFEKSGKDRVSGKSIPEPLIEEKLSIPRVKVSKKFTLGEKKKWKSKEVVMELTSIIKQKADFKVIVDKIVCGKTTEKRKIINSFGVKLEEEKNYFFIYGSVGGEKNGESQIVYFSESYLSPDKIDIRKICDEILNDFSFGNGKIESGKYNIVLPPKISAQFIEFIVQNFCGDRLVKGNSRFSIKDIGKKIFGDNIFICEIVEPKSFSQIKDEMKFNRGLRFFDDEGGVKNNFYLINGGVIENFFTDEKTSEILGIKNTRCSMRQNHLALPSQYFSALALLPGKIKREDAEKMPKTLYVSEIIGLHTGDEVRGNFSVGCRGYVLNSRQPFKTAVISGNIFEILKDAVLFSDFKVCGNIGTPSIMFQDVEVSS
ncbi:hypothetical protein HRbin19_00429 [bacterium HR19]|nr:hypothetical protein HRbin19_00429 [bacterium HR19]